MLTTQQNPTINGIDSSALQELVNAVSQDATQGELVFRATTSWRHGVCSTTRVTAFEWAGEPYSRDFTFTIDEPEELGGTNLGPNPQEVLLAAVNACLMATFVSLCSLQGITLDKVDITSRGQLNLRGFFQLDDTTPPGYQGVQWILTVKGNATPEQFQQVYEAALSASPNVWNMAHLVSIKPELQVES